MALSNYIDDDGRGYDWAEKEFIRTVNNSRFEGYTMRGYIGRHPLIDNGFELYEQDEKRIVFKFTDWLGSVSYVEVRK